MKICTTKSTVLSTELKGLFQEIELCDGTTLRLVVPLIYGTNINQ